MEQSHARGEKREGDMRCIAIDPGTEQSAWIVYNYSSKATSRILAPSLQAHEIVPNEILIQLLPTWRAQGDILAIEMVRSYGQCVGASTFETCVWIGRFIEAWGGPWAYVYRQDEFRYLLGKPTGNDSQIRQALIDRFGGSRKQAIGTKKNPGPLYGIKSHLWSALAVAVTYVEMTRDTKPKETL